MLTNPYRRPAIIFLLLVAFSVPVAHAEKYASIIIDDLGNNLDLGNRVIDVPGPLTLAFLPHTDFARTLADRAHQSGKEIMLHLPLQSVRHHTHTPGTLKLHMTHSQFVAQLQSDIASVPHIKGINNHMGSLLTQHPGHMDWLMSSLAEQGGLYFVDSRTTTKSIASLFAQKHNVPSLDRDIFLDPDFRLETIRREFSRFIERALEGDHAIAIAHPHPHTIQFIKAHIAELEEQGIKLVPVSELIAIKYRGEEVENVASSGTAGTGL